MDSDYYKKISFNLLTLGLIALALYLGNSIIIPFLFAVLLASLLLPAARFLERKKFGRVLSVLLPLILALVAISSVLYFLSSQVAHFFRDVPELKSRMNELTASAQHWIANHLNIEVSEQKEYISETTEKVKDQGAVIVGKTVVSITEMVSYMVLLPIYTFLILFYKDIFKQFFVRLFDGANSGKVLEILRQCRQISQRYVGGLLIETAIVFTLNTIGFLILGIQYAIFLALLAALLNLVPYIGMLVANVVCVIVTLISSNDPADAIWVAVVLALVQIFDNNFGMPMIVGNNVRINALVTIIGVLLGGALCGIPGMFLAIPGLAVLKIIFERVEGLEAWGILLGDEPAKQTSVQKKIADTLKKKK